MKEEQTKKASFTFDTYKVSNFYFSEPEKDKVEYSVKFDPSGKYYQKTGVFVLELEFNAFNDEETVAFINVKLTAFFKFSGIPLFEELPSYFYKNSIAIVFPYIRSFVTTLTSIGNIKPLILPVMNLGGLEKQFKENSSQIDE